MSLFLVLALSSGCEQTDPMRAARDAWADTAARLPQRSEPARHPVLGPGLPGNAFDDYALAAELAQAEMPSASTSRLAAASVVRGASRNSARDPSRFEIGPQALRHYRAAEVVAEVAREARDRGDLNEAIRYHVGLLRYGQDLLGGLLINTAVGAAIQHEAAQDLRDLVADPRATRRHHLQVAAQLAKILASTDTLANVLRSTAAGETRSMLSMTDAAGSRAVADEMAEEIADEIVGLTKFVDAGHQAPDWALELPGFAWMTCATSGTSAATCRMFREVVAKHNETQSALRRLRRIAQVRSL